MSPSTLPTAYTRDMLIKPYEWDVDAETYHATTEIIGRSQAGIFFKNSRKYEAYFITKTLPVPTPSAAQELGTLLHKAVWEPGDCTFAVEPECDRRTTKGKEIASQFALESVGKTVVTPEQFERVHGMRESLYRNPIARAYLEADGKTEHTIVWEDRETGLLRKSRRDKVYLDNTVVIDLKSCVDSTPEAFAWAADEFGYHRQDDWYLNGHYEFTGERAKFVFLVVASKPPYEVAYYELDDESKALGRRQNRAILSALKACMESGDFRPDHEKQVNVISLPKRAFYSDATAAAPTSDASFESAGARHEY